MALALLIMAGEIYRSIGDGRHIMFVLDDVFLGLAMFISALLFTKDTLPKRAFFAASWGAAAGGVYGSFFSKLLSEGLRIFRDSLLVHRGDSNSVVAGKGKDENEQGRFTVEIHRFLNVVIELAPDEFVPHEVRR